VHNRVGRRLSNPPNHTHTKLFFHLCVWLLVGLIPSEWERNSFQHAKVAMADLMRDRMRSTVSFNRRISASRRGSTLLVCNRERKLTCLLCTPSSSSRKRRRATCEHCQSPGRHVSSPPVDNIRTHGAQRYGACKNYKGIYLLYIPPRRILSIISTPIICVPLSRF
jgi:hypothetical protein